jgi:7,8-dihydropterin-6-yl-methyl-4-(beta-D-ribofuranosyl)aminobenzene 5'-phosphate synthase
VPSALGPAAVPLRAPGACSWGGCAALVPDGPQLVEAGFATTGPLSRMMFFEGMVEEQALVARLAGKGLVVVTGRGHPGVGALLAAVRRMSPEPVFALVGGLHLPVTASRITSNGIAWQRVLGTGKPPWRPISDRDVEAAVSRLNGAGVQVVLASPHDSCEHALGRLMDGLDAERVEVLRAGATYRL